MTLGLVAPKPIDEPGLGRAEEQPVSTGLLQGDEKLLTMIHCFVARDYRVLCAMRARAGDPARPVQHTLGGQL